MDMFCANFTFTYLANAFIQRDIALYYTLEKHWSRKIFEMSINDQNVIESH